MLYNTSELVEKYTKMIERAKQEGRSEFVIEKLTENLEAAKRRHGKIIPQVTIEQCINEYYGIPDTSADVQESFHLLDTAIGPILPNEDE